jgi:ABC-type transport system involved in multi-copper enzyme maturation permease subunit
MNAQLLHYRSWHGAFRRPLHAVWPIARVALALLLRRRLFWVLYGFALLLFLMFFFGSFLLDWAETQVAATPIQVGRLRADPERSARFIRQGLRILAGSQETFAYFFTYQGAMLIVILALAGSTLVGNDFTQRCLSFYLAKPIRPWHYILGKCLAAGAVVHLITTIPALALFAQNAFRDWSYLFDADYFTVNNLGQGPAGWRLLVGIVGYGMILAVFLGLTLVTMASILRRTMPLILGWVSAFLFLRILANVLVDGFRYDASWRLLDLWNNLGLLGRACLGFDPERLDLPAPQPTFTAAALTLLGVCTVCLMLLHRRTRGVPIVR